MVRKHQRRVQPSAHYALIQPLEQDDLDDLDWKRLTEKRLRNAWKGEDDALYDYL